MFRRKEKQRGFTLIELLVVIAIIGLLSSIVLTSLGKARLKARDVRRKADLDQIALAMQYYYDDNGFYPKESAGANGIIGEGAGLDAMLAPYFSSIPFDPLGPGDANYRYYYDGRQTCTGGAFSPISVIFARNLEEGSGNRSDFCTAWGGEGGAGGVNAWHVVLGESDG
ncbi:type II secretion system GspH family protein [Patescibacteria group bacterium]|nr:type II secretion system GspH family protein [Patescibacteria group bacterium]MCG2694970.1 type II secretion system GspH family protein [Candidatus Parcubacteria bacterium]